MSSFQKDLMHKKMLAPCGFIKNIFKTPNQSRQCEKVEGA